MKRTSFRKTNILMTDTLDTNLPEKNVELEEAKQVAEVAEQVAAAQPADAETTEPTIEQKLTKVQVVEKMQLLAQSDEEVSRAEIDALKQAFYKKHLAEVEAAKRAHIEAGGDADAFVAPIDELEEAFKQAMAIVKGRRNEANAELEKQKELNLQIKISIIEELKELLESPEDANKNYTEFKKLQQQWNETRLVPPNKINELWKSYQVCVEKFYDLLKLNNEFREYDFKKNLELKQHLCEAAEKLTEEPDAVSAFHQLQKLHQEYRETGPVAKELRDEIWSRFKAASTIINHTSRR